LPDKRITLNPIDTLGGFIAENVGSTSVVDPTWETLFSDTALQLPKGFYVAFYEITMESDTVQKPAEARIVGNGNPTDSYHVVLAEVGEQQTELVMYFFSVPSVRDVVFDFQFRNGVGGGGGATLTVNRLEFLLQMNAKRPVIPPFFVGVGTISQPLGVTL